MNKLLANIVSNPANMGLVVTSGQSVFDGLELHVRINVRIKRVPISTEDLGLSLNIEK